MDDTNLYHELKGHFGRSDLDFSKFCKKLAGTRRRGRAAAPGKVRLIRRWRGGLDEIWIRGAVDG